MTRAFLIATAAAAAVIGVAGCGGTASKMAEQTTDAATKPVTTRDTPVSLERAVRRAVNENHALLTQALLTNRVPAHPEGTAGPLLAYLRRSAAQRRAQGVTVRILSETFDVLAVKLDPTYTAATVTALNTQRVEPIYGRKPGRPSASREHVRLELHRVGNSERFVVWKVTLLR